jgi:hypothetical protein
MGAIFRHGMRHINVLWAHRPLRWKVSNLSRSAQRSEQCQGRILPAAIEIVEGFGAPVLALGNNILTKGAFVQLPGVLAELHTSL